MALKDAILGATLNSISLEEIKKNGIASLDSPVGHHGSRGEYVDLPESGAD